MEHRLALATISRWVLSSCIFVTSHASLSFLFPCLLWFLRKEPYVVTWKRQRSQRSQSSFFIFEVGSPKLHTSMFSCVHRRSTIWVTAGTSLGTPLRHCWRNHSCAGRSCLLACCVCLLILFYDRLCEEAAATWFVFLRSNMWAAFADIYGSSHSLLVRCC